MRAICGFVFLLLVLLAIPPRAEAARKVVAANLTENFVGVSEGFNGAKLTVFGVLKNKADTVIVIEGPPAEARVRKKTRQFGIWVNGEPEIIGPVPSFYAVVSSKPIKNIANAASIQQYGLDIDQLPFATTTFGAGLVDIKKSKNLYQYKPDGVKILESNLFRADIFLPTSVPIGAFQAHIYEFSGGKLSAARTETLYVAQVGLNAMINKMAHQSAFVYACLALLLSLSIGGGAAYLFRRMS